jgi:phosphoserine phosphatase
VSLLLTVTGRDHPGVTAALFDVLAEHGAQVSDVEQVVVHDRLLLGVVVSGTVDGGPDGTVDVVVDGPSLRAALAARAAQLDVAVEFTPLDDSAGVPPSGVRHHVTVLGAPLTPAALAGIARRVALCGANIDRILRLSSYPITAYDLLVSGGQTERLRAELAAEAVVQSVDVAVEQATLWRRARRLVVMDVDSTLVRGEVIEMLAAQAGCEAEVARVTEQAMAGELDFEASLRARVALLEGLPVSAVDAVRAQVRLTPGGRTLVRTLKRLGWAVGIVSGGFTCVTDDLVADLGLDHALANTLDVVDGRLTGRLRGPVVDRARKAEALREFAAAQGVTMAQTVAIGDGANDLDMLGAAGLGIAFNAKPVVREAADAALSVPFLDAVLFLLGVPREEVEAADAADGPVLGEDDRVEVLQG